MLLACPCTPPLLSASSVFPLILGYHDTSQSVKPVPQFWSPHQSKSSCTEEICMDNVCCGNTIQWLSWHSLIIPRRLAPQDLCIYSLLECSSTHHWVSNTEKHTRALSPLLHRSGPGYSQEKSLSSQWFHTGSLWTQTPQIHVKWLHFTSLIMWINSRAHLSIN